MIYLDTSVALASLFGEDRRPAPELWRQELVSSRLLAYELWNRVHSRGLAASCGEAVRDLLGRLAWLELDPDVLARASEPFPVAIRTLDALHLASFLCLRDDLGQRVELATYDRRQREAASALGAVLSPLV